jgi:hypothetical protein
VKEGVIEVGYTAAADEAKARFLVMCYMDALSLRKSFRMLYIFTIFTEVEKEC